MRSASAINSEISSVKKEISTLKSRKNKVSAVAGGMEKAVGDEISSFNKKSESGGTNLEKGVRNPWNITILYNELLNEKTETFGKDGCLEDARSDLYAEVSRCETRISELNSRLASLQAELKDARSAEGNVIAAFLGF